MPIENTTPAERADHICVVATVPFSLAVFMAPHIRTMSQAYEVTLVADSCSAEVSALLGPSVSFQPIRLSRDISIVADIWSLLALWRLFRRRQFRIVHSITPKAGLLAMIAARLAGVPVRVHWFTGQVWVTRRGIGRWILKTMDRLLAACSTHVLVDSPSQGAFLVRQGIVRPKQALVLGCGSVCGVDTTRFKPDLSARARIRTRLKIPDDAVVALYLGRLNRDKGLPELAEAFAISARKCSDLHLLVVGPDERGMRNRVIAALGGAGKRAHFEDFTAEPETHMAASDFFVLPSHREGFGSSVIEAAACGIPAIGTTIYGLCDALVDGESGLLVAVGDVDALAVAIVRLATDGALRQRMGRAARLRAERDFRQQHLTAALMEFYQDLLGSYGGPTRRGFGDPSAQPAQHERC
jgi:glycosyltransferase involved in cell wall biosynthesis